MTTGELTALLGRWDEPETLGRVLQMVYDDLRRIARSQFVRGGGPPTLQPTALLHEVYLHLADQPGLVFESRAHFVNTAALIMRRLAAKYVRARRCLKRGQGAAVTFDEAQDGGPAADPLVSAALCDALEALARQDPRKAQLAQMRLFLGLSEREIAALLDVHERTVRRDWVFVRAWLARALRGPSVAAAPAC